MPKALLEQLNAKPGDSLNYSFEDGKLIFEQKRKLRKLPKYDLTELLPEHKQVMDCLEAEYQTWDEQKPKGTEML